MNYKIVETDCDFPDVLLYRDRGDKGVEQVVVRATGFIDDDGDQMITEVIEFPTSESAINFIVDYSVKSANAFCVANNIKYS
jgi:hypothetical protein